MPLLADPSGRRDSAAYTQHPRPAYYEGEPEAMGVSVRTDRHRYTEWRAFRTGEVVARELYDHARDPAETDNLLSAPDADPPADVVTRLEAVFPRRGWTLDDE